MALGSPSHAIVRLCLSQVSFAVCGGAMLGLAIAFGVAQAIAAPLLCGISPNDGVTFLLATLAVVVSAVVSTFIPALRVVARGPLGSIWYE
jgi:hypothetical protein